MAKIGDRVVITIHGPNLVNDTSTGSTVIGQGTSIMLDGTIIEDLGGEWSIALDDPRIIGTDRIAVRKDRIA